jgi:hypothetical protein
MSALRLAVTSISLLEQCPLCFWLEYKKGVPRPGYPLPSILNQLDSAIKKYIRKYQNSGELPKWLAVNCFKGTLLGPQNLEYFNSDYEILLAGRLDELLAEGNSYCVIDFKSGKLPANGVVPYYYQIQLDAYAYLVERVRSATVSRGALIYFTLTSGEELENSLIPIDIKILEVKVAPESIPKILEKSRNIIELEVPPQPSESCIFCSWRAKLNSIL